MKVHGHAKPPLFGLFLIATVLGSRPAGAQIESALLSKISFNLSNPGGKSLAMGGAFTAIADDATAAIANPAGLGLLSTFEAGVSARRLDDVIGLVTARSTATGNLVAPYPAVRTINSDLTDTGSSVDFAGVVVPIGSRLVAALTYSENLRFQGEAGPDGYAYIELRDNRSRSPTSRLDYLFEYREFGSVSLTNHLIGVTAGFRLTDHIRLGGGVTFSRAAFTLGGDAAGPHRIVVRNFLTPTDMETLTTTMAVKNFGGTVAGFVAGFHADLIGDGRLTVGGSYRQSGSTSGMLVIGGDVTTPLRDSRERPFRFRVPRDAAFGLAGQPIPGLTVAVECQWIAYGDSLNESLPVVAYDGLVGPFPGFPYRGALANLSKAPDVVIPRVGIEYVATTPSLILAFRLGYHRDPARGVSADLTVRDAMDVVYDIDDPPYSQAVRTVFNGGQADDRFSGGLGATVASHLSFDLSFDVGRNARRLAASVFYRF